MRTITFFLLLTICVGAGPSPRDELAAASAYCQDVERLTQQSPSSMRFGADAQAWREYYDNAETFNDAAYVWLREGKIVAVNLTQQNESGDWVHYVNHCFRPDGSLARLKAVFNTFHGNMSVERERVYDSRGRLLRSRTKYLDLKERKPRRPGPDYKEHEFTVFRSVKELPFLALLPPNNKKPQP